MSDIKELYNRDIPHSHLGRFNTLNLSVILNFTNKVNAIQIKIAANYFMDIKKVILHLIWRGKRHSIANAILKSTVKGQILFNFKSYCKVNNQNSAV